jgi:hypothetical protein
MFIDRIYKCIKRKQNRIVGCINCRVLWSVLLFAGAIMLNMPMCEDETSDFIPIDHAPDLIYPANGDSISDDPIPFQWSAVENALEYILIIDSIEYRTISMEDGETTYTENVLDIGLGEHTWNVAAQRNFSRKQSDFPFSFTKVESPSE